MSLELTQNAYSAVNQVAKEPNLVLEIEGVPTLYGAVPIRKYAKIGDVGLEIGDPVVNPNAFYIGGFNLVGDQENAISFDGTTTSINQTLNTDKAQGGSVSALSIALIDDGSITRLITPGEIIDDILQAKCKVYLGFSNVAWPQDYVTIFRGVVTDVTSDAGKITLQINHPDDKKRGTLYKKVDTALNGAINNSQTTITLLSVANLLQPVTGPSGGIDTAFESAVRIDDEIIRYTGISGFNLTGCTRGYLNTTAASHADEAGVQSFYRLRGNVVDLSLKLMASGFAGPFIEDLEPSAVNITDIGTIPNALYFYDVFVKDKYNLAIGDYITTTGSVHAANNVSLKQILDIVDTEEGSYIVVDGVTFVDESMATTSMDVRSQYDTLPEGLKFTNDEIDIDEHLRLYQLFLSSVTYDIYLKDTIENVKEFIEAELYSPAAAYSLPRKSRASLGYHIGPIPGQDIQVLDNTSVRNPSKIKITRSTNRQFYNEIIYKFDESVLEDKFLTGVITIAADSKNQIKGYNKTLTVVSKGLRTVDLGESVATTQSNRRLNRYKFAAEVLTIEPMFGDSFNMEIGDIFIFDGTNLQTPDIKNAVKGMLPRFFEVQNKTLNIKTGDVKVDAVDTNFDGAARYGLISPSSQIATGVSTSEFVIKESYSGKFGAFEYRKWKNLVGASVLIRSADFTTFDDTVITSASSNTITVSPPLSFTPSVDMIMELTAYSDPDVTDKTKLIYAHLSPLTGGDPDYQML
jgi:hypothetical protein